MSRHDHAPTPHERAPTPHDRARALVLEHGWNATSYQILNPGFSLWFNHDSTAVAGYVEHHGVRVVAGVPVCPQDILARSITELEEDARAAGCDVAYFAVEERALPILRSRLDRELLVIGAQPAWTPQSLATTMRTHRSLRAQLNRAAAKLVHVEEWPWERARSSPDLTACLKQWLDARRLPPLHFLVETDTLENLLDRRVFVAVRADVVVGFLVASPIARRNGWLVEQNIRGAAAPNGTSESLLFHAATVLGADGAELITLGLSPLSEHAPRPDAAPPRAMRALFLWLRVHGRRFYNFQGLDRFKAKFRPDAWEPVYAVVREGAAGWKALLATGAAFGGTSAAPFMLKIVQHALTQEAERVLHWRR
jgi:phosphatidylglycerol lysyltransferase